MNQECSKSLKNDLVIMELLIKGNFSTPNSVATFYSLMIKILLENLSHLYYITCTNFEAICAWTIVIKTREYRFSSWQLQGYLWTFIFFCNIRHLTITEEIMGYFKRQYVLLHRRYLTFPEGWYKRPFLNWEIYWRKVIIRFLQSFISLTFFHKINIPGEFNINISHLATEFLKIVFSVILFVITYRRLKL